MLRVLFTHRCGASAEALIPERDPDALERKRRDVESRDCPFCEGDERQEGASLTAGQGRLDLWKFKEVPDGRRSG